MYTAGRKPVGTSSRHCSGLKWSEEKPIAQVTDYKNKPRWLGKTKSYCIAMDITQKQRESPENVQYFSVIHLANDYCSECIRNAKTVK